MSYRVEGFHQEISNKSGMGWKYATCLTNLAKVMAALPTNPFYPTIQVTDKTKFDLNCSLLIGADEREFVRMPWGLTHIPSGFVIMGDEPRAVNIISHNVYVYYNMRLGRGEGGTTPLRNYDLTATEFAFIAEQYKTGSISASVAALYLTYGSPRDMRETPDTERSLIHSFLTPRNPNQSFFAPESLPFTRRVSWQRLAEFVKVTSLPPLFWLVENMGLDSKFADPQFGGFPVAPPAEITRFNKTEPLAKDVIDSLLTAVRSRRNKSTSYGTFAEYADQSFQTDPDEAGSSAVITARRMSSNARNPSLNTLSTLNVLDALDFAEGRGVFDAAVMASMYDVTAVGNSGVELSGLVRDLTSVDPVGIDLETLELVNNSTASKFGSDFNTDYSFRKLMVKPRIEEPAPGVRAVSWDWVNRISKLFKIAADVIEGSVP